MDTFNLVLTALGTDTSAPYDNIDVAATYGNQLLAGMVTLCCVSAVCLFVYIRCGREAWFYPLCLVVCELCELCVWGVWVWVWAVCGPWGRICVYIYVFVHVGC